MTTRYLIRPQEVEAYHPANHHGTVNRRLVGPGVTTGSALEVIHGTIQPGKGALPHSHEGIEQVCYVLRGRAEAAVESQRFEMAPGDCCHFPAGASHTFTAIGDEPVEVLVIYTPPYGESA